MKRIFSILMIMICLIIFSGCGKLDISSKSDIKDNGSGVVSFKFTYDDIVASAA